MILKTLLALAMLGVIWIATAHWHQSLYDESHSVFGLYPVRIFLPNLVASLLVVLGVSALDIHLSRQRAAKALLALIGVAVGVAVIEIPAILGWVDYR